MNAADWLRALQEGTVAMTVALLAVLVVRAPLRRLGGAGVAYASWWFVPAALVATLLPAREAPVSISLHSVSIRLGSHVQSVQMPDATDWGPLALLAWGVGLAATVLAFAYQQGAFRRGLGGLVPRGDGMHQAGSLQGLPAAIGVWAPRIVVPRDFDQRYDADERALLQAHERAHIVHGDLVINAGAALLRCVFWFNPLLHWAARAFRHDQELACDQRVMTRHPQARRAYGEAMLKTQLASQPVPLGCHWGFSHPLKERIAMLNKPLPSTRRLLFGTTCVLALVLGGAYAAWAAQPARLMQPVRSELRVDTTLRIDGAAPVTATQMAENGRSFVLHQTANGHAWEVTAQVGSTPDGLHTVGAVITRDREIVGAPRIQLKPGEPGRIQIGEDSTSAGGGFKGIALDVTVWGPAVRNNTPPALEKPTAAAPVRSADPDQDGVAGLPAPTYPREALAKKIDGTVVLEIALDASGKITGVSIAKSDPTGVFDAAAIEAAWKWHFDPLMENGQPVAGRVQVPVRFEHHRPKGQGGKAQA